MRYAELPPSPSLSPWVKCIWIFESEGRSAPDRIVPDGRPELVVHFRAPYAELEASGRPTPQPAALFAGQLTRPLRLVATGAAGVVGVRFHPDGARALVGRPMRDTTDARIELDAWWPGGGSRLAAELARAHGDAARIAIVEHFVQARLRPGVPHDPAVRACVARIEAAGGEVEVAELAAHGSLGRRQLERRFADAVGIGPAMLAAIVRFRRVFDLIEADSTRPWTDAALAAGYFDQSHLIRDFRRFVGCTPTEFAASRPGLATALVDG